jgi:hypothetical protein
MDRTIKLLKEARDILFTYRYYNIEFSSCYNYSLNDVEEVVEQINKEIAQIKENKNDQKR